ncbi:hypothetical protein BU14_2597s0001 [Porphyra umbilicalis]|uniref:Uncharacterized protein n=1 Tax=Porphyra umbilicalis TaxID=2786 RepID=A0A1X6NIW0_PORUM|nr:hypothetical protein BU14_2597s0001 [Porphyra umbilicalis]|eukprot:OSX68548.1 hypothetical protein BU14_2597s0001 [Porphyra umbilicalis]
MPPRSSGGNRSSTGDAAAAASVPSAPTSRRYSRDTAGATPKSPSERRRPARPPGSGPKPAPTDPKPPRSVPPLTGREGAGRPPRPSRPTWTVDTTAAAASRRRRRTTDSVGGGSAQTGKRSGPKQRGGRGVGRGDASARTATAAPPRPPAGTPVMPGRGHTWS